MADTKTKKPALSSRLLQMKFMQKAAEKTKLLEAEERAQQAQAPSQDAEMEPAEDVQVKAEVNEEVQVKVEQPGVALEQQAQPRTGCRIIYDRAPLPAGLSAGRLSFGVPKQSPAEAQPSSTATEVTDAEMAKVLQKPKQQSKDKSSKARPASFTDFTSLREQKRGRKG